MDDARPTVPAPLPGERWVVRRRLPDGSATDVIGWVDKVDAEQVILTDVAGTAHAVRQSTIVAARRVPPAAGGPDARRISAETLERIAGTGWAAQEEALGSWVLRATGGGTRRVNSCLAVGDPERPYPEAAAAIRAWANARNIPPLAHVVLGSTEEARLRALGWRPVDGPTDVLACRLIDLVRTGAPDERVRVMTEVSADWLATYRRARSDVQHDAVRLPRQRASTCAYAAAPSGSASMTAIASAHLVDAWVGLSSVWVDPGWRRRGLAAGLLRTLGHWAARAGGRYAFVRVPAGVAEQALYRGLGFTPHHAYRYLAPPSHQD